MYEMIVLFFLVAYSPSGMDLRIVDRFPSLAACNTVVEAVKRSEVNTPKDEQITGRLMCSHVVYKPVEEEVKKPPIKHKLDT